MTGHGLPLIERETYNWGCLKKSSPADSLVVRFAIDEGVRCLGRKKAANWNFISGSRRQLIPDDHVLLRVDRVLDLFLVQVRHRARAPPCAPERFRDVLLPRRETLPEYISISASSTEFSRSIVLTDQLSPKVLSSQFRYLETDRANEIRPASEPPTFANARQAIKTEHRSRYSAESAIDAVSRNS